MLIKAYIKREMFRLPMDQNELQNQVEEAFKKIEKSNAGKIFPLTKIEENENILVEKQRTNIFLLNLLLLVLNHNKSGFTDEFNCNEENITSRLEEETGLDLKSITFDGVEKEVINFLNPPTAPTTKNEVEKEGFAYLKNVQFSVDWLKGAQKELEQKNIKQKQGQGQKKKQKDFDRRE